MKDTKDKIVRDLAKKVWNPGKGHEPWCEVCGENFISKCDKSCLGYRARKLVGKK